MRTVWTSMVSRPREMISSIPSTMVRPLQESGTPAGPSLIAIRSPPPKQTQGASHDNPFLLAVRQNSLDGSVSRLKAYDSS